MTGPPSRARRADAQRNALVIVEAAARVFAREGVDAPVRLVAVEAAVGMGTVYRHFPTRADLVVAVYRHQVEELAAAGPRLLASSASPMAAVRSWVGDFVAFLATKHGLADVLRSDPRGVGALHSLFLETLVPAMEDLLAAARESGEVRAPLTGYQTLRAIGDLCAWTVDDPDYDRSRVIAVFVNGLQVASDMSAPGTECRS